MQEVQKIKKTKKKIGGIVCKWIPSKGYGFIRIPGQEDDLYVHSSDIIPKERINLNIGEIVTFFIYTNKKSGRAKAIRVKGNGAGFTVNEEAGFTGVSKYPTENLPLLDIFQKSNDNNNNNKKVNNDNEGKNMNATEEKATRQVAFEEVTLETQPDTGCMASQPNDKSIAHHFQSEEEDISVRLKPEELQLWENFKALHTSIRDTTESDGSGRQIAQTYADAQDKCIFPTGRNSNISQINVPPMYMSRTSLSDDSNGAMCMRQSGTTYICDPAQTNQQDMLYMSSGENMHMPMGPIPMQNMPMQNMSMQNMSMQNMQPMVPILIDNPNNIMVPMNVMNPPMMPMDGSYTQLRVSYDDGNQLFPTGQNIQVEQIPYMNPNMGMRASYY